MFLEFAASLLDANPRIDLRMNRETCREYRIRRRAFLKSQWNHGSEDDTCEEISRETERSVKKVKMENELS